MRLLKRPPNLTKARPRAIRSNALLRRLPLWRPVRVSDLRLPSENVSERTSLAWTTCPYVIRDGKVNPDVRSLRGPDQINKSTQQIIYNAIAYILTSSDTYVSSLVQAIVAFYLNSKTAMNPNMNYGQLVRGPGPACQEGTFTGVLDGRGNIKTLNGYMLLKAINHPFWTKDLDKQMKNWMSKYTDWCTKSEIGKRALSRPKSVFFPAVVNDKP